MNRYAQRIEKLRASFAENGIDALFLNSNANVSYFTGKKGNDCSLYITPEEAWIITDFRYEEMAQSMSGWLSFYETAAGHGLMDFIKGREERTVGIELNYLPLSQYLEFQKLEGKSFKPVSGLVEALRDVKDEQELELLRKASQIGSDTFKYICGFLKPGMTELELAAEIEYQMKKRGAEGLSFDTIAISGAKTSMPHGTPDNKIIRSGEFVTMDYGCICEGYCSDMTRTVAVGKPTQDMIDVYNIVLRAQLNACEKIHAGLTGRECDALARDVIAEAGYGDRFGHSLGHGVGLFIHEGPRFNQKYDGIIPENAVVSIEPGIYLPGRFGVRIEDLAIIKDFGIINLVDAEKNLIIL